MENVNAVVISGNITRDTQVKEPASGFKTASFCVAVNKRKKEADGEYYDAASFVDCELFGSQAENVGPKLLKGTHVVVQGYLDVDSKKDKDGKTKKYWKVVATKVDFIARPVPADD